MFMKEAHVFVTGGRSNFRIPSIVAANDGTIFAFCNDRKNTVEDYAQEVTLVCARKKPGCNWEAVKELVSIPGWACSMGSAVYDGQTNTVMCSGNRIPVALNEFGKYTKEEIEKTEEEAQKRARSLNIASGQFIISSEDGGDTWNDNPMIIENTEHIHWDGTKGSIGGSCHGSAHGIQLKHGARQGRLICPSRTQIGHYNDWEGLRKCCYNNAVYSDDHGRTWKASAPVQLATGEGTLIERGDGTILYNSRAYYQDQKRYLAVSRDGGETYGEFTADEFLLEERNIGCNASFIRVEREDLADAYLLPEEAQAVTIFCNPRSATRDHMTACISFDDGASWTATRLIYAGPCAYSSLTYSSATQRFYLLYEFGESGPYDGGLRIAEFDLEWLLNKN